MYFSTPGNTDGVNMMNINRDVKCLWIRWFILLIFQVKFMHFLKVHYPQSEYNTQGFAYKKYKYHSLTEYSIDWWINQLFRN